MRILVCGGRTYGEELSEDIMARKTKSFEDYDNMYSILDVYLAPEYQPLHIIQGGARGADQMAGEWANERQVPQTVYPANWNLHGKSAGYIRNKQMLDEGNPDLVIAFPGGNGTHMMVDIARKAGVEVMEIEWVG